MLKNVLLDALDKSTESLRSIARRARTDVGTLSRFARGERSLSLDTADRLAAALGIEVRLSTHDRIHVPARLRPEPRTNR
jgi:transcriptional regulator with XRE-family HTH domain